MIGTKAITDPLQITSAAVTDRGLSEKRPQNEDSYLAVAQCGIFAVADGVGGAEGGEVASQMAVEILGEAFTNLTAGADPESVMRAAMDKANAAIFQMAHELPQLASMATTIAAIHLNENIATIGHVGDSRVYRLSPDGTFARETNDHSVVADEVRAGRMTEEQAENHPSRNLISRALGAESYVLPELKTTMVQPGTTFLLCSDGITRHIGDEELKGILSLGGSPQDACQILKTLCYERGAEDNLTAVIVRVGNVGAPSPADDQPVLQLDNEEPTVASARPAAGSAGLLDDEDNILELETTEPELEQPSEPESPPETADQPPFTETIRISEQTASASGESVAGLEPDGAAADAIEVPVASQPAISGAETVSAYEPEEALETVATAPEVETRPDRRPETFSMFGAGEDYQAEEKPGSLFRVASLFAMLVVGSLIGLGIYHFALAPARETAPNTNAGQLTEMRAANIPLSAFEENRRNVDKDPAVYIARFGASPQDCEDHYLLGRAYLLTGDFVKARAELTEARNRLSEADPVNAKTLANEIAVSLTVTNDTTVQTMLKKELDFASKPANTNANASANR